MLSFEYTKRPPKDAQLAHYSPHLLIYPCFRI